MGHRQLVLTRLVPGAMILILVYPVAAITLHLLPTGFNPVTHELSDYANGPYGWLMTVGFLGLGLGSLLLVCVGAVREGLLRMRDRLAAAGWESNRPHPHLTRE